MIDGKSGEDCPSDQEITSRTLLSFGTSNIYVDAQKELADTPHTLDTRFAPESPDPYLVGRMTAAVLSGSVECDSILLTPDIPERGPGRSMNLMKTFVAIRRLRRMLGDDFPIIWLADRLPAEEGMDIQPPLFAELRKEELAELPSVIDAIPPKPPLTGVAAEVEHSPRGEAMKRVVGPLMTQFLKPFYETPLSSEEEQKTGLKAEFQYYLGDLDDTAVALERILLNRFQSEKGEALQNLIDSLLQSRKDLFYYVDAERVVQEGFVTGIVVPLTIASHIYRIERNHLGEFASTIPLDLEYFIGIMQRPEFDEMLLKLTKGPNGFLGSSSTTPSLDGKGMFEFKIRGLNFEDAYKIRDGKVVGLSNAYHEIANARRTALRNEENLSYSSGCPVRHRFEDEDGKKQDSLIVTAKNFLIRALEVKVGQQKQADLLI